MSPANPFVDPLPTSDTDEELVKQAQAGHSAALERLVERHQAWIYNIAVRMVWRQDDAEDVAQEVLVKAVTKLSTFRGDSSFRTWLYRIACNHILNMQRRGPEAEFLTFSQIGDDLDRVPEQDLPDPSTVPVDLPVLVEEAKLGCLSAMLLCLDRRQRLAYTLVELLGATSAMAAELMEITPANLRQILHRARRDLYQFMNRKCGLVNKSNPCRCAKKTKAFMEAGYVEPDHIRFAEPHAAKFNETATEKLDVLESKVDELHRRQQREGRFMSPPDLTRSLMRFLEDPQVRNTLNLDD